MVSGVHTAGSSAPGPTSVAGAVCSALVASEEGVMSVFQACRLGTEQKTFILIMDIREVFPAEVACELGLGRLVRF